MKPNELKRLEYLITQWHGTQEKLTESKLKEAELRQQIFDLAFPNPKQGSNALKLPYNMALVGRPKTNYTIDKEALESARQSGQITDLLFHEAFRLYPKINESSYRMLDAQQKRLLSCCVTEKPGMPLLEVKPQDKVKGLK
jgi:hypothetical protein